MATLFHDHSNHFISKLKTIINILFDAEAGVIFTGKKIVLEGTPEAFYY